MVYEQLIKQPTKMLNALDKLIDKAVANAELKKYDVANVLQARLIADQFNFIRQVQITCDTVKVGAARLAGQEPPKHPDTETTVAELKTRIKTVTDYLATFKAESFKEYESRVVPLGFMPGKGVKGDDFLTEMVIPNFYFHLTTAYSILRMSGVDVGKMDFLSSLNLRDL